MAKTSIMLYLLVLLVLIILALGKNNPLRKNRGYRKSIHRMRKYREQFFTIVLIFVCFMTSYFVLSRAAENQNPAIAAPSNHSKSGRVKFNNYQSISLPEAKSLDRKQSHFNHNPLLQPAGKASTTSKTNNRQLNDFGISRQ